MEGLVVHQKTPLIDAIRQFAADHTLHSIFIVDHLGRLTGVINNSDLLDWARLHFDLLPSDLPLPVGKVRRLLSAETVHDLALPDSHKMAVSMSDELGEALMKMAEFELEDIPVVDDQGVLVNDLRLSEVLAFALSDEP
jgi:CBS-domain-containing membrane protein